MNKHELKMSTAKNLLIIYHSEGGETRKLADSIILGATKLKLVGLKVSVEDPITVDVAKVIDADGVILGTSENFGYMSGALKHFFDRIYYPCLEKKRGLPYALFVKARNDGSGAVRSIEKITLGLGWRKISDALVFTDEINEKDFSKCEEFGALIATGLEAGLF